MEFTIDLELVRDILKREQDATRVVIAEVSPLSALKKSLQRHDERLASASDASTLACKPGCAWCCHFSVDVRPVEVLNILNYVDANFSVESKQQLRDAVTANARVLENLSELERASRNVKCPFLSAGHCSIYPARPQTCRNYHATSVAGCQKTYEEPDNLDIDPEFAPITYQIGGAHVEAFSAALSEAGYDVGAYELNAALAVAWQDPLGLQLRFESRSGAFPGLRGTAVPNEFLDD